MQNDMQPEKLSGEELVRLALSGLRRIAFGPACDPVRIALCENSPSPTELAQMDLFLISEIKRPKEGSCEIKFHDRMKAMEMLIAYGERHSGSGVQGILDALSSNGDFGEASAV